MSFNSETEKTTVYYPITRIIARPEFEQYLLKKEWFKDLKLWRSKDCHETLHLENLGRSLKRLAELECRTTGELWDDIMSPVATKDAEMTYEQLKEKLELTERRLTEALFLLQHHCDGHKDILQAKNKLLDEMGLLKASVK
jgi:hypothetical protein